MEVQFDASVAPIVVATPMQRNTFHRDARGLSFEGGGGDYKFTERLAGTKHFGLWPLAEAATACFGTPDWPDHVPAPQASIEFDVPDVSAAADELTANGYQLHSRLAHRALAADTARLLSPEGLLVAVCYTPSFHDSPASQSFQGSVAPACPLSV